MIILSKNKLEDSTDTLDLEFYNKKRKIRDLNMAEPIDKECKVRGSPYPSEDSLSSGRT